MLRQCDLFTSGHEAYHTFRIPSIVATRTGSLLAFCEGRRSGRGDSGDIDILLRRSDDGRYVSVSGLGNFFATWNPG